MPANKEKTITITLKDNDAHTVPYGTSGYDIAATISKKLAKHAIAMKLDNQLYDLTLPITKDSTLHIITSEDEEALEIIRHDTAHILAEAVKELYPETQVTIGPAIKNGFYYDFARSEPFTPEDLERIEKRMQEIIQRNETIERRVVARQEAIDLFMSMGEHYKAEIIASIPAEEAISLYQQGNFIDVCRGPHSPSTGTPKAFKLTKISGAYWRGDASNEMLQRIYGTAWPTQKQLKNYLFQLEEAEKRDHRRLGKTLELFHIQEEATGQIFWHPNGWTLYQQLQQYIRQKLQEHNYQEVKTPILVDRALWQKSGHWDKFGEYMFTSTSEEKVLAIKPMNCPCHVQIFNQNLKSYRDLPMRMSEFGSCHRNEPSGSLHGLMRVRGFTQDDAHIFCTEAQITSETIAFCTLLQQVYNDLGFHEIAVKFSDRPEKRAGSDEIWDKAEQALKEAIEATHLPYTLNPGEGAFYGPKIEFILRDAIGRDWQCGTLQVDFVLPNRLQAHYVGTDGEKHHPVMLHRAILGSFERFIGILIEQYAGKFPLWLAPIQVAVITITNEVDSYAKEVSQQLRNHNIRVVTDISADKISYKIRRYSLQKIPLLIILGKQEMEHNTVSTRKLGSKEQHSMDLTTLLQQLKEEIHNRK